MPDAEEVAAEAMHQRQIELASSIFDKAAAYENGIILAGFGAFFALWAGMASHLSSQIVLLTGSSFGVALMLYVGWNVYMMLWRTGWHRPYREVLDADLPASRKAELWTAVQQRHRREALTVISKVWPLVLIPCLFLSFGSAMVLAVAGYVEVVRTAG